MKARGRRDSEIKTRPGLPVVRALDRGLALLKAFTSARPRQTLTELTRAADLDMGTARRLLQTLVLAGLVEHDDRTALYALSAGLLEIAAAVHTGRELLIKSVAFKEHLAR